jgi:hypothetical protein
MSLTKDLEKYRDLKAEVQPLLDQLKNLEKSIKQEILSTGEIPEVDGVDVKIRKGYVRSSWDNKMLRGYAVSRPEILDFVKEIEVGPSVVFKIA